MTFQRLCFLIWAFSLCSTAQLSAQEKEQPQYSFARHAAPFLRAHCVSCHGNDEPESGLSFTKYDKSANIQADYEIWEKVRRMLVERQMPPEDKPRPPERELRAAVAAIDAELAKFDCDDQEHPGRVTIRRLNRAEYNNTVRDLVGIDFTPADDFPSDDVGNGFDNIGDVLSMSPLLVEKYVAAAEAIVDKALDDDEARGTIFADRAGDDLSEREAVRNNLTRFVGRAFRRPATEEELSRLFRFVRSTMEQGATDEEAARTALVAILASPHFLFRVELDPETEAPVRQLNDFELASRLSYFLWSSMPDEELFRLARQGELHKPAQLETQVKRMPPRRVWLACLCPMECTYPTGPPHPRALALARPTFWSRSPRFRKICWFLADSRMTRGVPTATAPVTMRAALRCF